MAKTAIQKITLNQAENIPFDKIELSQKNVRSIKNGVTIEQLAEDIAHRGLLQSLNVRPIRDADGQETGRFDAPAGGRRYKAIELLIKQKRMAKTQPTPCVVNRAETTSAEEDSLAENTQREELHPMDQFRAFKTLSDQGLDTSEIAARFFVSPTFVKQRLKLAAVSSKLLDIYEKGEIRLDQLEAFSVSEDHVRQEQVWERVSKSHMDEPYYIRRLLTETTVRADDRRAIYVGAEAYEVAGGVIMRDLFDEDEGGWFQDAALLEQLVFEKLKVDAEAIRADGWKWVEAAISLPYGHASGMRRFYGELREMTAEEIEKLDALQAEYDKLDAEYAEAEDYDEAVENKIEQLGGEIDALNDRPEVYDPEQVRIAGVFVTLGVSGRLAIERGFVRPEDEPKAGAAAGDEGIGGETDDDDDADGHYHGVNGVMVNGKPATGGDDDSEDDGIKPLSDSLIYELTAQRTLALRNTLASEPGIAFVAALHAFVLQTFHHFSSETCLEVSLKTNGFPGVKDLRETPWAKEIAERHQAWGRDLPEDRKDFWDFLLGLDEASRKALFAHCVSLSVNAVNEKWNRRPQALAHADVLASTLQFDMVSAGWTPTVDNYLGKVTKTRILQAVREARGEESAQLIDHLKKQDMAREAARLLEGSNWLPEPLRSPEDVTAEADGDIDATSGEIDDEANLPAYLTGDDAGSPGSLEAAE
ncbi:ParB/RepB/Spo0J family partition protein [Mesorhizobium sp. STM 4661]|uniref:ParB/RepB/Spo0J family partition protein n=1 Tax=Mesorhizobium sp. STM 4661 TaxID=1297570 RepID=UPI0003A19E52|nr:ParB/RepB/Spo0J family partition protein [Mesorhizobium sp. STM 4661]